MSPASASRWNSKAGAPKTFDRVVVAVGRQPRSARLGLETTRVRVDGRGALVIDDRCRTDDPRVYAVGDVTGEPMLAHRAMRQGKVAAEVIAGRPAPFDNVAVPAVVFTDPELAWCGLTERLAEEASRPVSVARFSWSASGRAATLGRSDGLTKLVVDPESGVVLGAGVVGPGAGELIAEAALAVETAALPRTSPPPSTLTRPSPRAGWRRPRHYSSPGGHTRGHRLCQHLHPRQCVVTWARSLALDRTHGLLFPARALAIRGKHRYPPRDEPPTYRVICPRTSPPGKVTVCTFA